MEHYTPGPWEVKETFSTHNHPTRYWETAVSSFSGIVARAAGYFDSEAKANAELISRAPQMELALRAIAALGGNLSDDRLTENTGPNDAAHRGLIYTEARRLANAALSGMPLGLTIDGAGR